MHFGLITGSFLPRCGGLEWKVHFLASEYVRQGHEVTVIHQRLPRDQDGALPIEPRYRVVRVRPRPRRGFGRLRVTELSLTLRALWEHWRKPFDLLHCHSLQEPTSAGVNLKTLAGLPVVATTTGTDVLDEDLAGPSGRARFYRRLIVRNVTRVDAVGAVCGEIRDRLKAIANHTPILMIPNGADWETMQQGNGQQVRESLGLHYGELLILSLGRNEPVKNYEAGLRAFGKVASRFPTARYAIVGSGALRLQRTVEELDLKSKVHLRECAPISEVPNLMHACDLFFSPSLREGFAQVVAQALCVGRPCAVSNGPGNADLSPDQGVEVAEGTDPEALARALMSLVANGERRQHYAAKASAAGRRYAWSHIAKEYEAVFVDLVDKRRAQARTLIPASK